MAADPFSGIVLAGGRSSRMGRDKALITTDDGETLVVRCADALTRAGADDVAVVGGAGAAIADLGLPYVADRYPDEGPLGGIIAGLGHASHGLVVVLACDHTNPQAQQIADLVSAVAADPTNPEVVFPVVQGRRQILHSAWRRSCLPALQKAFDSGVRAPRRAITTLRVGEWEPHETWGFHSANTPSELEAGLEPPN